jgi:uncharacterized membrane protein
MTPWLLYLVAGTLLIVSGLGFLAWEILYGAPGNEWSVTAVAFILAAYILITIQRSEKGDNQ